MTEQQMIDAAWEDFTRMEMPMDKAAFTILAKGIAQRQRRGCRKVLAENIVELVINTDKPHEGALKLYGLIENAPPTEGE